MRFVDHRRTSRICVAIAMMATAAAARAQSQAVTAGEANASVPESASVDDSTPDNPAADWTPQSWQRHIQEERWRIENLAMLRRLTRAVASEPTIEELERQASEKAFSDSTLERGDIIVTTKGFFVFKGHASEQRLPADFEEVKASSLAPPGKPGREFSSAKRAFSWGRLR